METADDLIDALGGNTPVAALTGVRNNAVSMWRAKGYIPPRHSFVLRRVAAERGIDVPDELFRERAEAA